MMENLTTQFPVNLLIMYLNADRKISFISHHTELHIPDELLSKSFLELSNFKFMTEVVHELSERISKKCYDEFCLVNKDTFNGNHVYWKIVFIKINNLSNPEIIITGFFLEQQYPADDSSVHFEYLINHIPHLIFWKDTNSRYLGCNQQFAHAVGLACPQEIIGKSDYDMPWPKEESDKFVADDQEIFRTGVGRINYEETQRQDRIMLVSKVPIHTKRNKITGLLCIYTDITERKRHERMLQEAKEKAEAANKAKSAFVANMSHDVRGPVASTIGISKLLEVESDIDQARQYGHILHEANDKLLELLDDILDMVAAEDQEDQLKIETFNLKDRLVDLKKLLIGHATLKNIDIRVTIDPLLPKYVVSDKSKFFRILLNLLNNAIKFTSEGSIQIDAELLKQEDKHLQILFRITDTGIGIPKDKLDQIFDRFFRVTPSFNDTYSGYGLGLFLVKKFVHLLRGKIDVASELGKGSQFAVLLPMEIGNEKDVKCDDSLEASFVTKQLIKSQKKMDFKPKTSSKQLLGNSPPLQHKALIIEDDSIARHVMIMSIKEFGFDVTVADSAESGFSDLLNGSYDIIITDIGLPGLDGNQLTALIRSWERISKRDPLPIVGLSAHGSVQQDKSLAAGMDIVLTKPIDEKKLNTIMEKFFNGKQQISSE